MQLNAKQSVLDHEGNPTPGEPQADADGSTVIVILPTTASSKMQICSAWRP